MVVLCYFALFVFCFWIFSSESLPCDDVLYRLLSRPLPSVCFLPYLPSNIRGCQSGTWSQRGTKVTGHIMVTTRYPDQQESKSRQKVIRLYKRWHRPITKRFIKPPLLHIESVYLINLFHLIVVSLSSFCVFLSLYVCLWPHI